MTWTRFIDARSGGYAKLEKKRIYIEAGRARAIKAFKRRFNRDPENITCRCCGPDYGITECIEVDASPKLLPKCQVIDSRAVSKILSEVSA